MEHDLSQAKLAVYVPCERCVMGINPDHKACSECAGTGEKIAKVPLGEVLKAR